MHLKQVEKKETPSASHRSARPVWGSTAFTKSSPVRHPPSTIHCLRLFTLFHLCLFFNPLQAQVDYNIRLLTDSVTYQVSLKSNVTWAPPLNITNSAQVTLVVPTGGFQVTALQSQNGQWVNNVHVVAPTENPVDDYFSFALSGNTTNIQYQNGLEVPLFTFRNAGNCTGDLMLINNDTDPFMPPNMVQAAVGNAISVLAGGAGNVYGENYHIGYAPCDPNGCSNGWNDAWLPDTLEICAGDTLDLDLDLNLPTGNYMWSPSIAMSCATCLETQVFPSTTTRYVLSQERPDGCLTSDSLLVLVHPTPVITDVPTMPDSCGLGFGLAVIQAQNGQFSYSINGQNWQQTGLFQNLIADDYTAYLRDDISGCITTENLTVDAVFCDTFCVDTYNDAWLPDTLQICAGQSLMMNVQAPAGNVTWSPSVGVACPTCAMTNIAPSQTTKYTFSYQKPDGCFIKDTVLIIVRPLPVFTSVLVKPDSCGTVPSGSINVTAQAQNGVEYSINAGLIWQTAGQFPNLPEGDYWVWIRDAVTGCATTYVGNPLKVICTQEPVGKIGGFAFLDCHQIGAFNSLEYLIPQVPILLQGLTPTGDSITQIGQTDPFGFYTFENLPTGVYTVRFDTLLGAGFSPQDAISNDTLDSDVNNFSGETFGIFLPPGGCIDYTAAGYWDTLAPALSWANPSLAHLSQNDTIFLDCGQELTFSENDIKAIDLQITDAPVKSVNRIPIPLNNCDKGIYKIEKIEWMAEDVCGNVADLAIFLAYLDTFPPTILDIPQDLTLNIGQLLLEADTLLAADDCTGIAAWAFAENPIIEDCQAEIYRTWAATDFCNNTTFVQQRIEQPLSIAATADVEAESCAGLDGVISMFPPELQYNWQSGETGNLLTDLGEGSYTVTISDQQSGCVESRKIDLENDCKCTLPIPNQVCIFKATCGEYDGGITVQMDDSPFRYDWLWTPNLGDEGSTPAERTKLPPFDYAVDLIIPLESACKATILATVPEYPCDSILNPFQVDSISVPYVIQKGSQFDTVQISGLLFPPINGGVIKVETGISPNGDGINETLILTKNPKEIIELRIFSRWGLQVYHSEAYQSEWQGEWEGRKLPTGVYFLVGQSRTGRRYEGWVFLQ